MPHTHTIVISTTLLKHSQTQQMDKKVAMVNAVNKLAQKD